MEKIVSEVSKKKATAVMRTCRRMQYKFKVLYQSTTHLHQDRELIPDCS